MPIPVKRKKKRGRPAIIGLRMPKEDIARLDKWAKASGYKRSEAIRVLIGRAVNRP
jgi:hypothetical protein